MECLNLDMVLALGFRVRTQDIRTSERRFHQKITDIYAASIDYDEVACPAKESSRATASCACRACVALGVT